MRYMLSFIMAEKNDNFEVKTDSKYNKQFLNALKSVLFASKLGEIITTVSNVAFKAMNNKFNKNLQELLIL
jgi:hypothetical protein